MFSYFSAPQPENSLQTLRNYCIRAWASSFSWQPGLQSTGVTAPAQASRPSLSGEPSRLCQVLSQWSQGGLRARQDFFQFFIWLTNEKNEKNEKIKKTLVFSYFSAPRPENSLQTLRNYCIRAWASSSSSWQPGLQSPRVPAPAQASSPSLS